VAFLVLNLELDSYDTLGPMFDADHPTDRTTANVAARTADKPTHVQSGSEFPLFGGGEFPLLATP
jgi:hypothetical protein